MLIARNAMITIIFSAGGLTLPLLAGCSHSHASSKGGGGSTMSPIAKTVDNSGFKEEKKATEAKHGD